MATVWINYIPGKEHLDCVLTKQNGQVIAIEKKLSYGDIFLKTQDPKVKINIIISSPDITLRKMTLLKKYDLITLKKILPNMLEEEILSPIEDTYFSYAKQANDNSILCAIASKSFIHSITVFFKQHKIPLDSMYPLSGLAIENDLTKPAIFSNEENLLLVPVSHPSIMVDSIFFHMLFEGNVSQFSESKPDINEFTVHDKNTEILSRLSFKNPQFQFSIENPFNDNEQSAINGIKFIKQVFVFSLFCLSLFIIRHIMVYNTYSKQSALLESEIQTLYKKIIPNATANLDPRVRIESELRKKQGNQSVDKNDFLTLLYQLANSVEHIKKNHTASDLTFVSTHYQAKKIRAVLLFTNHALVQELKKNIPSDYQIKDISVQKINSLYQVELELYRK